MAEWKKHTSFEPRYCFNWVTLVCNLFGPKGFIGKMKNSLSVLANSFKKWKK